MQGSIVTLYRSIVATEKGSIRKEWGGKKLSVALAYPNVYRVGMSNLGFHIVYGLFNRRPDVVAERVFLPEGQEMSLYLQSGGPLLSLESQKPVHDFDLLAFSLSFENDYPNILKILELSGIALQAQGRTEEDPFVLGGGVTTSLNPEPIAPFFDFFLLGEAETNVSTFVDLLVELRGQGYRRDEILKNLCAGMNSLYAPSFYRPEYNEDGTIRVFQTVLQGIPERIRAPVLSTLTGPEASASTILTPDTEFSDRVLIELGRGCGHACRFCAAGYVYRPPRTYPEEAIRTTVKTALSTSRRVGLLSAAVSDIPGIENITREIVKSDGDFSVSSLRAETITVGLLEDLRSSGQRTIAIAPEAGSERLRRVINKHLSEEQILEAVRLISTVYPFNLRLYFLIGLPTETQEDIAAIPTLVKRIKHAMIKTSAKRGKIGRIRLSVNCFIPKPFTPFQWFPLEETATLREKQRWLKKALVKQGGVQVHFDLPKWAYVQALLSNGDRRVAPIILEAHRNQGNWKKAFLVSKMNPDFFVHRAREFEETLPWDFIDHGLSKRHLVREYSLALKGRQSEGCRVGDCHRCGIC
jgi:radical SAM family uncharacterized protein